MHKNVTEAYEKLPLPNSRLVGHPLEQCLFAASYWRDFSHFFQGMFSLLAVLALCAIVAISYVSAF